jgi:hypothetical protein
MWFRQAALIFKVLRQRDPAMISGMALAWCSNETSVAESSNADAARSYDYEISV